MSQPAPIRKLIMLTQDIADNVRSKFNFSIDKFPLAGPEGMRTPFYGLFRSDTHMVVGQGSVTQRYVPHTTDDVLALVEAASAAFDGVAAVQCHFREGHYVTIEPTKQQRLSIFGENDSAWARIVIAASYDGKAFKGCVGLYRDLCNNLCMLRTVKAATVSIRHTAGLRPKMNELIETFGVLKESWGTISATILAMEASKVNMVDFLNAIYGDSPAELGRGATMHRNRTEAIVRRLLSERMRSGRGDLADDFRVTAWEAYNAIQGYVQHDAGRHGSKAGLVCDMDRIILASQSPQVLRAEELAVAA